MWSFRWIVLDPSGLRQHYKHLTLAAETTSEEFYFNG